MTDKNTVADWSATAADNDNVGGISLSENVMRPKHVNNAFREMMAQIKAAYSTSDADGYGGVGDGETDDTTAVSDASEANLAAKKTYKTTLEEVPAGFSGPGDLILASPERRYSVTRIEARQLTPPSGLGWTPTILPIYKGGRWRGHVPARSLFPDVDGATYYVDPSIGSDSNAGSDTAPFATITEALEQSDVGEVVVAPIPTALAHETYSFWGNPTITTSAAHVIVRPWDLRLGRPTVARCYNHQESTWTVDTTYDRVYNATIAAVIGVMDLAGGLDGKPVFYMSVASKSQLQNRPGAYFYDSGVLSINTINGAVPSPSIKIVRSGTCGYWASNKGLYIDGLDFIGGTNAMEVHDQTCDVILTNCRGLASQQNAFSINTSGEAILEHCGGGFAGLDVFNYHESATNGPGKVIEINNYTLGLSGVGVSSSNQASTVHDGILVARYGVDYDGTGQQVMADVSGSKAWNVGCRLGWSRDGSSKNIGYDLSDAEGWLYDCELGHAARELLVTSNGTAHLHNTHPGVYTAATGSTITEYQQA